MSNCELDVALECWKCQWMSQDDSEVEIVHQEKVILLTALIHVWCLILVLESLL